MPKATPFIFCVTQHHSFIFMRLVHRYIHAYPHYAHVQSATVITYNAVQPTTWSCNCSTYSCSTIQFQCNSRYSLCNADIHYVPTCATYTRHNPKCMQHEQQLCNCTNNKCMQTYCRCNYATTCYCAYCMRLCLLSKCW